MRKRRGVQREAARLSVSPRSAPLGSPDSKAKAYAMGVYLIRRMSSGRRCRKRLRFLQSRFVSMGEKTDVRWQETEGPARAESATRRSRISEQYASAADQHPSRIHPPAGAAQERRYRGHHRDVRFRAHRTAGNRAGAMHTVEKREYLEDVRGRAGPAPRGSASREELAGDVALLRRSARAFAQADDLVAHPGTRAAALCGLFRRRAGNYGSGQPRSV